MGNSKVVTEERVEARKALSDYIHDTNAIAEKGVLFAGASVNIRKTGSCVLLLTIDRVSAILA